MDITITIETEIAEDGYLAMQGEFTDSPDAPLFVDRLNGQIYIEIEKYREFTSAEEAEDFAGNLPLELKDVWVRAKAVSWTERKVLVDYLPRMSTREHRYFQCDYGDIGELAKYFDHHLERGDFRRHGVQVEGAESETQKGLRVYALYLTQDYERASDYGKTWRYMRIVARATLHGKTIGRGFSCTFPSDCSEEARQQFEREAKEEARSNAESFLEKVKCEGGKA
jgi:hypothetical protein